MADETKKPTIDGAATQTDAPATKPQEQSGAANDQPPADAVKPTGDGDGTNPESVEGDPNPDKTEDKPEGDNTLAEGQNEPKTTPDDADKPEDKAPDTAPAQPDAPVKTDAPAAPPVATPPAQQAAPTPARNGRKKTGPVIRPLREFAARLGLAYRHLVSPADLQEAIANFGEDPALAVQEPQGPFWILDSPEVGTGPATLTDHDGWWSATVHNDGSFEIVAYGSPNLLNRRPGEAHSSDQVFAGASLTEFVARLQELRTITDPVFEAALVKIHEERQAEAARLDAESGREEEEPVEAEPTKIDRLREIGSEFGLAHVSDADLPYKVAEALGIKDGEIVEDEGREVFVRFELDEMADKVLKHAAAAA